MKPSSSAEDMKRGGRGAPQTSSVAVSLHPLVIMNISEHWTRMWAQSADGKPIQVLFHFLLLMLRLITLASVYL